MPKDIYDLELHDNVNTSIQTNTLRVPGGWIYRTWSTEHGDWISQVFVPYNNEFMDLS